MNYSEAVNYIENLQAEAGSDLSGKIFSGYDRESGE